jgi:cell wall-associated NlpC family hydrolase
MKKAVLALLLAFAVCFTGFEFHSNTTEAASTPLNNTIHKLLGIRYRAGGTTPGGFDCSGFTSYVYAQFHISLPHQSISQSQVGAAVRRVNLRPGDLVFFRTGGRYISHVGIYTGGGRFVHAAPSGIRSDSMNEAYYRNRYVTARRVMNQATYTRVALGVPARTVTTASAK